MGSAPSSRSRGIASRQAAREKLAEAPRGYVWGGAGTGDTMRANLEALRAWRIVPRHLRAVGDARPLGRGARLEAPRPGRARADRRPDDRPSGGRARERARRGRGRRPVHGEHGGDPSDGGDRAGRRHALVPALLAQGRRALRVARAPRRGRRVHARSSSRSTRSSWAGGPTDLAQGYLPFLRGRGRRAVLQRPGLPLAARAPARGGRAGRRGALGLGRQQGRAVGRPRVAARDHRPADRAQGRPAPRRRPQGARGRHGRRRGLQSRRPPGRRRDRARSTRSRRWPKRSAAS